MSVTAERGVEWYQKQMLTEFNLKMQLHYLVMRKDSDIEFLTEKMDDKCRQIRKLEEKINEQRKELTKLYGLPFANELTIIENA